MTRPRAVPHGFFVPVHAPVPQGIPPKITISHRKWNEKLEWEKAAGHAIDIISHDQVCTDAMKRAIRK